MSHAPPRIDRTTTGQGKAGTRVSKKRAAARGKKPDGARKASAGVLRAPRATAATYAVSCAVVFLSFFLLVGWTAFFPLLTAPLVAGVLAALCLHDPRASGLAGGASGLLASAAAIPAYAMPGLYDRALAAPPDTNVDIPRLLYEIVGNFVARNPLNSLPQAYGMVLLLASGAAGTAAVAYAAAALIRRGTGDGARLRRHVSAGIVVVVALSYLATSLSASAEMIAFADQEPVRGQYAFDATVYLKTYYNMVRGQDYYTALVDAAAGDARVIEDTKTGIRDGKSYGGWLWGPAAMRRPTIFYVWRYVAPGGGGGIVYLAAILGAASLGLLWWGMAPYLSYRAAFVPVFVMPYLLFMTLGLNVFFPDFWAALLVVAALALVMRRQWIAGAVAFLAAAAVRETVGPALAVLAVLLVAVWLREGRGREWLVRAGTFAAGAAAWFGLERVHEAAGARYMAVPYPSALQVLTMTMNTRTLAEKVVRPVQYLIFPYGFYAVPGLVFALAAPLGFWAVLASRRDVRLVVVGYMLFWIAFLLVVGATSSYWGQMIMLPSLAGVGCLLVSADRMDRRLEMGSPVD